MRGEFNRYRNRLGHMGTKWSNPLEFTVSFIKDVCSESSDQNLYFTEEEVNAINAWLTSPDYPTLFHMYDYDFERDTLDNMVLVDAPEDNISYTIIADGYPVITYELRGEHCRMIWDEISTPRPPKPRVKWYKGYYSLQFFQSDFPSKIQSIISNGIEYKSIQTNEWLSAYDALYHNPTYFHQNGIMMNPIGTLYPADSLFENTYTVLLHKTKVLNVKYDYYGIFTNIEPQMAGANIIGFNATFTTDSPFAWTNEIAQNIIVDGSAELNFNVVSAEKYRELYPVIRIHVPRGEELGSERTTIIFDCINDDLSIRLSLMQEATTIFDCQSHRIVYVRDDDPKEREILDSINDIFMGIGGIGNSYIENGAINFSDIDTDSTQQVDYDSPDDIDWGNVVVVDPDVPDDPGNTVDVTLYERDEIEEESFPEDAFNTKYIYWPRLHHGLNTYRFLGDCEVTMIYREPRKVGDW